MELQYCLKLQISIRQWNDIWCEGYEIKDIKNQTVFEVKKRTQITEKIEIRIKLSIKTKNSIRRRIVMMNDIYWTSL